MLTEASSNGVRAKPNGEKEVFFRPVISLKCTVFKALQKEFQVPQFPCAAKSFRGTKQAPLSLRFSLFFSGFPRKRTTIFLSFLLWERLSGTSAPPQRKYTTEEKAEKQKEASVGPSVP